MKRPSRTVIDNRLKYRKRIHEKYPELRQINCRIYNLDNKYEKDKDSND
jgi:hypothetical protein